jgi:hypothetical protein
MTRIRSGTVGWTWKDLWATVAMAAVAAAYAAHLAGTSTWLLDSVRGTTGLVLVLGALGCGFGNAAELYLAERTPAVQAYTLLTGALGLTALGAAAYALVTASTVGLAVLVAAVATLWLLATARHLLVAPATPTRHEPVLGPDADRRLETLRR